MTYEEIMNILEINGKESPVFMPNELFEDLQVYLFDSSHMAYAYCYLYLSHFLYRNCKYFNVKALLDNNMLKEILGYKKSNRTMNYITMKKGLLSSLKYTETTKNYPLSWTYEDKELTFLTVDDMGEYMEYVSPVPKMFFLNYPLLAMADKRIITRIFIKDGIEATEEVEIQGSYFDIEQTTSVDFNIFMFCMSKEDLGVVAFYLYSWLRHNCNIHEGRYDVPLTKLAEETGITRKTIQKYMNLLKGYRMVEFKHNMEFFIIGAFKEDRLATSYYTNEYDSFSEKLLPYEKLDVLPRMEYLEIKAWEENARRDEDKANGIVKVDKKLNISSCELPY